jgi:1-acyl-sn-glycerol-3-phosphate acyltransferase
MSVANFWTGLRELGQRGLVAPLLRRHFGLTASWDTEPDVLPAPCVFAANHGSHLDSLAFLAALPPALRARTRIAAAEDYWYRRPSTRLAAALCNAFPFPRKGGEGLDRAAALLAEGSCVLLYPAGTREGGGRFRWGVGELALRASAPVVPVAILGGADAWPKGRRLPRRAALEVRFGPPLRFEPGVSKEEATACIERAVRRLSGGEPAEAAGSPAPALGGEVAGRDRSVA